MSRKSNHSNAEVFETMYQKFYVDTIEALFRHLKPGTQIYPDAETIHAITANCLKEKCAFRFLYNPSKGMIEPLKKGDDKFRFGYAIDNKKFFERYVHRSFLIPYWLYAWFAYKIAGQRKATKEEVLEMKYRVELPVRLPSQKSYAWYLQESRVLAVDEHNQVISHINIYHYLRPLLTESFTETRVIEATVLKDEQLNEKFRQLLKKQLTEYFNKSVFLKQEISVIRYYSEMNKNKNNNKNNNETLDKPYRESYIQDINKDILEKMRLHTGYKFMNIHQVVAYLKEINVSLTKRPAQ